MAMRMVLAFILHRGRMSCSAAAGSICSDSVNRGEVTRCLARGYWRKIDLNSTLVSALLAKESKRGAFLFIVDATQKTLAGKKSQNTYFCSSVTRRRSNRKPKNKRYNAKKTTAKSIHSYTFGLLITPSVFVFPSRYHITHQSGITARTSAECAAEMIRTLPQGRGRNCVRRFCLRC